MQTPPPPPKKKREFPNSFSKSRPSAMKLSHFQKDNFYQKNLIIKFCFAPQLL